MTKFKVVSLDMFQTLVNVNSRRHSTWHKILGDAYSESLAEEYWGESSKLVLGYFNKLVSEERAFYKVKSIFENCYRELFLQRGINFDPKEGAKILAYEHGRAFSYEDTETFLAALSQAYPICLVSDTDRDMIQPLLERFKFDQTFLSEDFQCYKFNPNSTLFNEVINHYQVDPKEIIHIGDGYSDVVGANRAGITTCWLNRAKSQWNHPIKPDYTITSLREAVAILGVKEY